MKALLRRRLLLAAAKRAIAKPKPEEPLRPAPRLFVVTREGYCGSCDFETKIQPCLICRAEIKYGNLAAFPTRVLDEVCKLIA